MVPMENYHILERIGEGSFGKVYRGRRKYTGQIVALKFVSKRGRSSKELHNLREEIDILTKLNHGNIITMLDFFETENEFCMVTEYGQGELFQVLEEDRFLPESVIQKISIQLLQALKVLHTHKIIHRDMKPQNILIGANEQIKLCDFGFARALQHDHSVLHSIKGTPLYMAPELVQEKPYNYTVDLWSLGVILFELATGKPPFYTDRIVSLIQMIIREPVRYPKTMSKELTSFLKGLLEKDPRRRLTWPHIQEHPFVRENAQEVATRELQQKEMKILPRYFPHDNLDGSPTKCARKMSVERIKIHYKKSAPAQNNTRGTDSDLQEQNDSLRVDEEIKDNQDFKPNNSERPIGKTDKVVTNEQVKRQTGVIANANSDIVSRMEALWGELKDDFENEDISSDVNNSKPIQSLIQLCTAVTDTSYATESSHAQQVMHQFTQKLHKRLLIYYREFQASSVAITTKREDFKCLHSSLISWSIIMTGVVSSKRPDTLDEMVLWHNLLRCCIVNSNILDFYFRNQQNDHQMSKMYREFCQKNTALVKKVLQIDASDAITIHGKALKWLGALIDKSSNIVVLLKEVDQSGIIDLLCKLLSHLKKKLVLNTANTKHEDNIHFIVFLLSEVVLPTSQYCHLLLPFHVRNASSNNERRLTSADSEKTVREMFEKIRLFQGVCARVQSIVRRAIDERGLRLMISILDRILKEPDDDRRRKSTCESRQGMFSTKSEKEQQAEDENSLTCCILKILLYAMDSSDRRNMKRCPRKSNLETGNDPWRQSASILTQMLLQAIRNDALQPRELLMSIALLSVLIRRKFTTGTEDYACAAVMYRLLVNARKRTLLSFLCAFFVSIDEYSFPDMESEEDYDLEYREQVEQFLHHGILNKQCVSSILHLIIQKTEHDQIQEYHVILASFSIKACGFMDAGIMLLMRSSIKMIPDLQKWTFESDCGKIVLKSIELQARRTFLSQFITRKGIWKGFKHLLENDASGELSPRGAICLVRFLLTLRQALMEAQRSELTALNAAEENFHEIILPSIVKLLSTDRIEWILHLPECIGGGINSVRALIHATIEVLGMPFMHSSTAESTSTVSTNLSGHLPIASSIIRTQEVLHECDAVRTIVKAVQFYVANAHPNEDVCTLLTAPVSFLSRLITSSHHFAAQFIESKGLLMMKYVLCGSNQETLHAKDGDCLESAISGSPHTTLVANTLSILNHLARTSAEYYLHLMDFGIIDRLHHLLKHFNEAAIRAKVLNTIGNLCRHSNLFYPMVLSTRCSDNANNNDHSLLDFMVEALDDKDKTARRFACFAIGNASFHDASLYTYLRPAIPGLLRNADRADAKTRSNASGALGNLVRNSDLLCLDLCTAKIPQHIWRIAQREKDTTTRQTLLFSVGNFCVYPLCVNCIVEAHPNFVEELMEFHANSLLHDDRNSQSNINRILGKLEALYQQHVSE
uniref:non-specific serine/threonine protein kinase n=1 Tax=Albugo laibachii Nc14 TaxID=890382 RepID=F0WHZ4_9STRA|nr:protein kinase putative [Albugo laibachii Nc14]|eukprot:CCA20871.1 protein kinase putative [Albugo laibachii Nc14]